MVNPVPGYGITTAYGKPGRLWSLGFHTGVDISGAGVSGKPIVSATPGRVIAANAYDKAYGYKVIIRWGNYDVWYCHMPSGAARVRVGQTVTAGQRIGSVGATGNVTGPHLHMELRVAGGGFAAANFRDPSLAINYKATAPTPPAPVVKPKSTGTWFTIGSYNLKSPTLTPSGKHAWTLRRARQIANIGAAKVDVLCLQEVGNKTNASWYDTELKKLGLVRADGTKWRYNYIRASVVKRLAGGTVELTPILDGDEKQMTWSLLDIDGSFGLVGNIHLEEANGNEADKVRPKQATNAVQQLDQIANRPDIVALTNGEPIVRDRYFIPGDTNSEGVVAERMRTHGFVSALTNALKSNGGYIATFNNWLAARRGKQIDYIFVDRRRPVEAWSQKPDNVASDHNLIWAVIGRSN